eukprot:gene14366-biopygen14179
MRASLPRCGSARAPSTRCSTSRISCSPPRRATARLWVRARLGLVRVSSGTEGLQHPGPARVICIHPDVESRRHCVCNFSSKSEASLSHAYKIISVEGEPPPPPPGWSNSVTSASRTSTRRWSARRFAAALPGSGGSVRSLKKTLA